MKDNLEELIQSKINEWKTEAAKKGGKPYSFNRELMFRRGWSSFNNPLSISQNKRLEEGLTRTYPAIKVEKWLCDYYRLESWQIEIFVTNKDNYGFQITIPSSEGNDEEINDAMERMGYFLSKTKEAYNFDEGEVWATYQFEPKFQPNETQTIKEEIFALYHVTPVYNKEKIMKNGLCPKSRNSEFSYPSRVYFFTDKFSQAAVRKHIENFHDTESQRNEVDRTQGIYSLFEIKVDDLPDSVELHYDMNLDGAVWTTSNIPPQIIAFLKDFDLNK